MSLPIEKPNEARLQIKLLGTPQIRFDGKRLTGLKSVKAQALLFYLAVTRRIHTRPVLAGLLWGDLPEAAARANLSKAIGLLRKHIGKLLAVERNTISLAQEEVCWVDAVAFDSIFQEVARTGNYNRLQEVIELYRGDFLEGFYIRKAPDYEKWWLVERARLREQYLNSLQLLADHRAKDGDLGGAIALSRRYLNLEPWREEAHRRLMLMLAQSGQRGAALVQYETCRRILVDELDTVPSEVTTALFKRIQVEDFVLKPIPASYTEETQPAQPAFLTEDAQEEVLSKAPIVGRETQLMRLDSFLENALKGQGQVAFINGEAGWGKTRLLNEFSRLAQQSHPDLIVASGTCTITTGIGDPYQPFCEITRMLTGEIEGLWAAGAISTNHALRLWYLLPQTAAALVNHGPDLIASFISGNSLLNHLAIHDIHNSELMENLHRLIRRVQNGTLDTGLDQERIFEEFTNVLVDLSRNQPILLILDDLHWADSSSIGLLFHLSRKISKNRILILCAYRTEEITIDQEAIRHPLANIFSEIKGLLGDVWVQLDQDQPAESRAFVEAIIDQEPNLLGEDFRQKLTQNTGGQPLFTVEMLRDLRERGDLIHDQQGHWIEGPSIKWDTLPHRVEGVIEKRIGRLTPALKEVLMVASVEGEEFSAEVIARVHNLTERKVVSLLSNDLAKKHHLVAPIGIQQLKAQRISRYRFNHHLFHKYVYDVIDPIERAYLHQAVGEALEGLYQEQTEQINVQLGTHFQLAGIRDKAVRYFERAGNAARRVYANTEAIIHYQKAIDLGKQIERNAEDLISLYLNLGRALELDSQFDQALKTYQEMEDLAYRISDRTMELAALIAQVTILAVPTAVHEPTQAQRIGERALSLAENLGDQQAEAKILWSLSLANYLSGRLNDAIANGERSLNLARQLDLRRQRAYTLNDLGGFIYLYSGCLEQSKVALKEARELWHELGNKPMTADSLSGSCVVHVYTGEFDQAIQYSRQALQISQEIKNIWGQSYALWSVGEVYLARGEYSQAIEVMEECIRLGEMAGFVPPQTYTRSYLALAFADIGLLDRALEIVQLGLKISQSQIPLHNAQLLGTLARLQIKNGELNAAEKTIRIGRNETSHHSWKVFYLPVLMAEAELAYYSGENRHGLEIAEEIIKQLNQFGMRSRLVEVFYLKGLILEGMNQEEEARECQLESRAIAEDLIERRILWRVLYALSKLESDGTKSKTYQQAACNVINIVASHIEQEDFRNAFLNQPEIVTILTISA